MQGRVGQREVICHRTRHAGPRSGPLLGWSLHIYSKSCVELFASSPRPAPAGGVGENRVPKPSLPERGAVPKRVPICRQTRFRRATVVALCKRRRLSFPSNCRRAAPAGSGRTLCHNRSRSLDFRLPAGSKKYFAGAEQRRDAGGAIAGTALEVVDRRENRRTLGRRDLSQGSECQRPLRGTSPVRLLLTCMICPPSTGHAGAHIIAPPARLHAGAVLSVIQWWRQEISLCAPIASEAFR